MDRSIGGCAGDAGGGAVWSWDRELLARLGGGFIYPGHTQRYVNVVVVGWSRGGPPKLPGLVQLGQG